MARIIDYGEREHVKADGFPKTAFKTRSYAKQIERQMRRQGAKGIRSYRCSICGNYHVGNAPGTKTHQTIRPGRESTA